MNASKVRLRKIREVLVNMRAYYSADLTLKVLLEALNKTVQTRDNARIVHPDLGVIVVRRAETFVSSMNIAELSTIMQFATHLSELCKPYLARKGAYNPLERLEQLDTESIG